MNATSWALPTDPAMVGEARAMVRKTLTDWGLPHLVDDAELVISELVTNARAPRGALSYPQRSWEELKGGFWARWLTRTRKGEGDNSMPENQWSCSGMETMH
ncbi:hypothetical protein AB0M95_19615 [Sphaerisporangium sp. NPDC051017]|uniref:ATP-binding protein n=1 Tax=Sphaerisporangium sp. NPDC051017 TaxID=3154636 RepID=UPI003411FAEC